MDMATNRTFGRIICRVINKEHLSQGEAYDAFAMVLNNAVSDMQQGAFLATLTAKGETAQEVAGGWRAVYDLDTNKVDFSDLTVVDNCGTGVDNTGLKRKCEVIDRALRLHHPAPDDGLELLAPLGGFELGGIAGAVLAAAAHGCCVVLDGVISTAAGLLAYLICPAVGGYLVAGHRSVEQGQQAALKLMNLSPVVDLDFRLGEGTGAAVTMNLVDLACRIMREMASFAEVGVDSGDT